MPILPHDELPIHDVPRIKTRVLVSAQRGAAETAVWEQWIDAGGHIPLHYHDVEEVLVFSAGEIALTLSEQTTTVSAPATVIIPAGEVHSMQPTGSAQVRLLAFFPTSSPKTFSPNGNLRPMPWEDFDAALPPE